MIIVAAVAGGALVAWFIWKMFGPNITAVVFWLAGPAIERYVISYEAINSLWLPSLLTEIIFPTNLYELSEANLRTVKTAKPGSLSAMKVLDILVYPAIFVRPFFVLILPYLLYLLYKRTRPSRQATRENIYSLAKRLAPLFPQIMIAIYDKKHRGGYDEGSYRREDTPIRFAINHGLLHAHKRNWDGSLSEETVEVSFDSSKANSNAHLVIEDHLERGISSVHERCQFDKQRAAKVFTSQLGPLWTSIEDLSHSHKLLFCAIALFANGKKRESYKLFEDICRQWAPEKPRNHLIFDPKFIKNLIDSVSDSDDVKFAINNHAYVTTVFQGLLFQARKRGRVPSNLFYWLKREDRILWYSLNQEGGQCGWTESGGPRSHLLAERAVKKSLNDTGFSALYNPEIQEGIDALYSLLYKEGWIADIYPSELKSGV